MPKTVPISDGAYRWLQDAPAYSAEILAVLDNWPEPTPPDPTPEPLPPGPIEETDMDYPKNEAEFRSLMQKYATETYVGMLDPRTNITLNQTLEIVGPNTANPWGVNGNYAKIKMAGQGDVLRFIGQQGGNCRGLTVKNLSIDGGDPNLNGSLGKACVKLSAPLGDDGPIYKFNIENVFTSMAEYGFVLEGGVYEGWMINCHAENMSKDGTMMRHMNLGQPKQGVVSNVLMIHPNMSRCLGAGIRSVYSVYVIGGSFIINGGGGIVAPDGLRGAIMCNGENTAGPEQAAFVVPNNGYGSVVDLCEASSDGATICRKWNGTAWVNVGSPMLYGIAAPAAVTSDPTRSHTSYYGNPPNPMRWRK